MNSIISHFKKIPAILFWTLLASLLFGIGCGESLKERSELSTGHKADSKESTDDPYGITYGDPSGDKRVGAIISGSSLQCTGMIYNKCMVITANHCATSITQDSFTTQNIIQDPIADRRYFLTQELVSVPNFDDSIRLLRLAKAYEEHANIGALPKMDEKAGMVGYGKDKMETTGPWVGVKKSGKARVTLARDYIIEVFSHSGPGKIQMVCSGDSGGPLFNSSLNNYLGVLYSGDTGCVDYGIYMALAPHKEQIDALAKKWCEQKASDTVLEVSVIIGAKEWTNQDSTYVEVSVDGQPRPKCASNCMYQVPLNSKISVQAKSDSHQFTNWDLRDWQANETKCGSNNPCTFNMPNARKVIASFKGSPAPPSSDSKYVINVKRTGTGTGTVASLNIPINKQINCGSICRREYKMTRDFPARMRFAAAADSGSVFVEWKDCDAIELGQCVVNSGKNKEIIARFEKLKATPYPSPTATPKPSPTPSPKPSVIPSASPSVKPSPFPTALPSPSSTPTPYPTYLPLPTPTPNTRSCRLKKLTPGWSIISSTCLVSEQCGPVPNFIVAPPVGSEITVLCIQK